ncbi:hypothetical protein QJ857_gp0312 [Tupanvirus soda lake]|uniref:Uncharacterized protein n=2 Tax=Tupanvirus TaxID=2094720 RepID=A0A6N1NWK0_9VIRU|nr:hypothetical protein QJ857_gp0312 [Tupanvirus soda lake]QKU35716.1 hypothetical protein [Tupanvirus soda lake]
MPYDVFVRKQFNFVVSDKVLSCLLTSNVSPGNNINVNINGILIHRVGDQNYVVLVAGEVDPRGDKYLSNKQQIDQFRENLELLDIDYRESRVIQIFNIQDATGTPGMIRIPLVALACKNIPINNFYVGEPKPGDVVSIFIEVPNKRIIEALCIIKNINTENPENNLCINLNNFECKCSCLQDDEEDDDVIFKHKKLYKCCNK